jgi:hypothetical protein
MSGAPPDEATTLRLYPWIVLRFRCHYCERSVDMRLADAVVWYGRRSTLGQLLRRFVSECPWDPESTLRKPQKYGHKCGAYCPDIGRGGPPDLPPAMRGLTVIDGGKDDRLPAAPRERRRRRRIGAPEE